MGDTEAAKAALAENRIGRTVDKAELARVTGYSVSWIEKLMKQGLPIKNQGRKRSGVATTFDTAQVLDWMLAAERKKIEAKYEELVRLLKKQVGVVDENGNPIGNAADDLMTETEAKRRERSAKAQIAELELKEKQGIMVEVAKAVAMLEKIITNCRARLLSIPSKTAAQVADVKNAKEANTIIEREIYEALYELSNFDLITVVNQSGDVTVDAAAAADGE